MESVRIIVADDHKVVRQAVMLQLESRHGWQVVGEARTGREAVEKVRRYLPDVVLLDIAMPELNGVDATREIRKLAPSTEVLILTQHNYAPLFRRALEVGARGCVVKSDAAIDLINAVEAVSQHGKFLSVTVAATLKGQSTKSRNSVGEVEPDGHRLTRRETEIVQLLAGGRTRKEVAARLQIPLLTLEKHRDVIWNKLGIHSLGELIHFAILHNLTDA